MFRTLSLIAADYPFVNYYVISRPRAEAETFFRSARTRAMEALTPTRLAEASGGVPLLPEPSALESVPCLVSLCEEVATIARPPVEPTSKRPVSEATGYVLCVYKVFSGDDGEKFERNWLYWTGTYCKTATFGMMMR